MNLNLSQIEDYRKAKAAEPKIHVDTGVYADMIRVRLEVNGQTMLAEFVSYGAFFNWRLRRAKKKLLKRWRIILEIERS